MNYFCIATFLAIGFSAFAELEQTTHGTPSLQFSKSSSNKDHNHASALLGSKHSVNEYGDLNEQESKSRLKILAQKMDLDNNGIINKDELINWVYDSLINLDKEETEERFLEIDINNDGEITWEEYIQDAFGIEPGKEGETIPTDPEEKNLLNEDQKYFLAANQKKNGKLSKREFQAFQNPEHFTEMHDALIENSLIEKDVDKDGKISLKEFMGTTYDEPESEWFASEKERFVKEYDKNKDGFLEGDEIRNWLIPDTRQTATQESEHLLELSDKDKNGELSIDEIVEAYKVFLGSETTNYGEKLLEIHDEL